MTPADLELAREAVGLPTWRWLGGMRRVRFALVDDDRLFPGHGRIDDRHSDTVPWWTATLDRPLNGAGIHVPDLTDDCTRGGVLRLVREAHGPQASTRYDGTLDDGAWTDGPWLVVSTSQHVSIEIARGPTEPAALVAALRSAPVRAPSTVEGSGKLPTDSEAP